MPKRNRAPSRGNSPGSSAGKGYISSLGWDTDECVTSRDSSRSPRYGRNNLEQQFAKHSPWSPKPFEGLVYEAKLVS